MLRRLPHQVRLVPDPALLRGRDVLSIAGDVSGLRGLGIEPASADIEADLAGLMDATLAASRSPTAGT
jgi:hypothetical protein